MPSTRNSRVAFWTIACALAVCLAAVPSPAAAQQLRTSASIAVSVTVVRSCSVSSPDSVAPDTAARAALRLSCAIGQHAAVPISTLSSTQAPTSVPGASAAPGLSTARRAGELVLSINF